MLMDINKIPVQDIIRKDFANKITNKKLVI